MTTAKPGRIAGIFLHFVQLIAALMAAASLAMAMGMFLGSDGPEMRALNSLLYAWCLTAVATVGLSLYLLRQSGEPLASRLLGRLPSWLIVFIAGLLIIAALESLAIVVMTRIVPATEASTSHLPAIALGLSALAFGAGYAAARRDRPAVATRRFAAPGDG